MRTIEQIEKIKSRVSDPYKVDNFLSADDVTHLIKIFNDHAGDYTHKNTGPITLDLYPYFEDSIVKRILEDLRTQIGDYEIDGAFFFHVDYPHILHIDDTFELKDVYKGITIPLRAEGLKTDVFPKICFFNQHYFLGPAKFFRDELDMPAYYNTPVFDYSNVDGKIGGKFDVAQRLKYFTHLKPRWLDGLSLHSTIDWKPTSIVIFDSTRIHCASDFRTLDIKSKLGISIFTRKP
jgi:hypothetical protein